MQFNFDNVEAQLIIQENVEEFQAFADWHSELGKKISYIQGYLKNGEKWRISQLLEELMEIYLCEEMEESGSLRDILDDPMYKTKLNRLEEKWKSES